MIAIEIIKNLFIAIGGGATAAAIVVGFIKLAFSKLFENTVDAIFDKNLESYRNKLNRTTTAYEIILRKEFDFYERVDSHIATYVPSVQNLESYAIGNGITDIDYQRKKYMETLRAYWETLPAPKSDILIYQSYIPENVSIEVFMLIGLLQDKLELWRDIANLILEASGDDIDEEAVSEASKLLIAQMESVTVAVRNRLNELSTA